MDTSTTPPEPGPEHRPATGPDAGNDDATATSPSGTDADEPSPASTPSTAGADAPSSPGAETSPTDGGAPSSPAADTPLPGADGDDHTSDQTPPRGPDAPTPPAAGPPPGGSPPPPPGGASSTGGAAPPPPPRPSRTRQLTRRSRDRVIAGVAGGLGDYFNVDPAIFRLAFVGLMFIGGAGLPLYGIAWLFLPDRDSGRSVGDGLLRRFNVGNRAAGRIVLAVLVVIVLANTSHTFGGGWLWAALLVGLGFLLFRDSDEEEDERQGPSGDIGPSTPTERDPARRTTPAQPHGGTPPDDAPAFEAASTNPYDDAYYSDLMTVPPPPRTDDGWRPTPLAEPPEPPPPPSILGRVTVAAVLIVVGAVALLESLLPAFDVATATYVAAALAIVGGGLVVGARWGRARGLIVLGGVMIVVLSASTAVPDVPTGIGQRRYVPENVSELASEYRLGMGELQIDLTRLELEPGEEVAVEASTAVGSLQVIVPDSATVEGRAEVQLGAVDVLDRTSDGTPATLTIADEGDEDGATIDLDLSAVLGEIEVHRSDERGRAVRPAAEGI
jgi:phage shock protein PspC (stress-responsive transcriptional regulator)/predicted membrane protein